MHGVRVLSDRLKRNIGARRGVVLASGGFEGNADMKAQFPQAKPVLNAAARTNSGDGIRMAQDLGAALWHMWHIHGAYGFRHTVPNYPYGIRMKRFPDWFPGEADKARLQMAWILWINTVAGVSCPYSAIRAGRRGAAIAVFDPATQLSAQPGFA